MHREYQKPTKTMMPQAATKGQSQSQGKPRDKKRIPPYSNGECFGKMPMPLVRAYELGSRRDNRTVGDKFRARVREVFLFGKGRNIPSVTNGCGRTPLQRVYCAMQRYTGENITRRCIAVPPDVRCEMYWYVDAVLSNPLEDRSRLVE